MKTTIMAMIFMLGFSVCWVASTYAEAEPESFYGVIAISQNTGRYGYCCGHYTNKKQASDHALDLCGTRDAEVVLWAKNKWFALASGGGGAFGWAYGYDPDEVKECALRNCLRFSRSAKIVVLKHSNSQKKSGNTNSISNSKPDWNYQRISYSK